MAHNYSRLFYHFVWATWDRTPLLTGEIEARAYSLLRGQCSAMDAKLHAVGGIDNHVHLLVSLPATVSVAEFVKSAKGVSSRALNEAFARPAWSFKWQGRYGVHTVSPSQVGIITGYVENQKRHHATGDLWLSSEQAEEGD